MPEWRARFSENVEIWNALQISTSLFTNSSRVVALIVVFFFFFLLLTFTELSRILLFYICRSAFVCVKLVLDRAVKWTNDSGGPFDHQQIVWRVHPVPLCQHPLCHGTPVLYLPVLSTPGVP